MTDLRIKINDILTKWDPIEVGKDIASSEYTLYVPVIISTILNNDSLLDCIENILTDSIGLEHNKNDVEHLRDINNVCDEINKAYEAYKNLQKDKNSSVKKI